MSTAIALTVLAFSRKFRSIKFSIHRDDKFDSYPCDDTSTMRVKMSIFFISSNDNKCQEGWAVILPLYEWEPKILMEYNFSLQNGFTLVKVVNETKICKSNLLITHHTLVVSGLRGGTLTTELPLWPNE